MSETINHQEMVQTAESSKTELSPQTSETITQKVDTRLKSAIETVDSIAAQNPYEAKTEAGLKNEAKTKITKLSQELGDAVFALKGEKAEAPQMPISQAEHAQVLNAEEQKLYQELLTNCSDQLKNASIEEMYGVDSLLPYRQFVLTDVELECGLPPSEKTHYQTMVKQAAEEYKRKYHLGECFDPDTITQETVVVNGQQASEMSQFTYSPLHDMCMAMEENSRNRRLFFTKESLDTTHGEEHIEHELGHMGRSPDCPIGLDEGGAQYFSTETSQGFFTYVNNRKEGYKQAIGQIDTEDLKNILPGELNQYTVPYLVFSNLAAVTSKEAMAEYYFNGSREKIDQCLSPRQRVLFDNTIAALNAVYEAERGNTSVHQHQLRDTTSALANSLLLRVVK